ncbi:hypothetical protein [Phycicoccus sp.]|uniref:hypothetical protein n=1 Tax=Phycicoccus sp. TaxID=1902410 RepID=UPI002C311F51|nr:hypothetical protein [Phycicoccus sp.]HMM95879.1 hypothetical protein [Phycicoccus sp.]
MTGRPPTRHRARTVAALLLVALAGCSGAGGRSPAVPPSAPSGALSASAAGRSASDVASVLQDLLARRDAAVLTGDTAAFRATLADAGSREGRAQLGQLATARALRVQRLAHDVVAPVDDPSAVDVTVRYRLGGLDRADRTATVRYAVAEVDGRWRVRSATPADGRAAPPWVVLPGATVRRTAHAVVVGVGAAGELAAASATVDRALPGLRRTWDGTPAQVLVLLPGTAAQAAALLGHAGTTVGEVAGTTDGPVGADGRATGDRVVLDPVAHRRLTPSGRDVVLTHELTHVAVRATLAGTTPTWLAEGYADHLGYARADVAVSALLAPLTAAVRAGTAPTAVPTAADLDPAQGDIEVGYLAAWQAVELVAERDGEGAVVRLVRACTVPGDEDAAERACDAAMPAVLGTDRAGFTRAWRQRLAALAR